MRRRRSSTAAFVVAGAFLALATASARAQDDLTREGAPFLLIPVGARALGMGQAVVAAQQGSEAVWWNPAGLARSEKREIAIHHYQSFVGTGDVVSVLIPSERLGVITGSIYILNYGEQEISGGGGGPPIGSLNPRNLVYAATYSTGIGSRINGGVTFKVVQFRVDCSGACSDIPTVSASTTAIDVGAQFDVAGVAPLTLGAAVRNVGLSLQVNDREQSDPLPTRIQVGALYHTAVPTTVVRDTEVRLSADLIDELELRSPAARVGGVVSYRTRFHLRTGYVFDQSESSGASLGLGFSTSNLSVDLARLFEGFSRSVGEAPTYVSLRYLF
ncbi:MAG TPA: PorV/PorQ family protein [Gemmatimonadaceae bacterium]|nr:PorV/PorQ family protein [Gemmatimonadaceae bacterium]